MAAADPGFLTSRAREVVSLVSQGLSNKEVAQRLNIAEGTVKIHLLGYIRNSAFQTVQLSRRWQYDLRRLLIKELPIERRSKTWRAWLARPLGQPGRTVEHCGKAGRQIPQTARRVVR